MRVLWAWGAVLLVSVLNGYAAPTEDGPVCCCAKLSEPDKLPKPGPEVAPSLPETKPAGYRKETLATISRNSSLSKIKSKIKHKKKVKVKHLKNGNTVTIIKDKFRWKTRPTLREVDIHKRVQKHRIVTDKYGKVISDKVREKNKVKKKKKAIRTSEFVHTRKSVPPGGPPAKLPVDAPAEPPVKDQAGYRKETLATISRNSSLSKIKSKTKQKKKVKVKHLKNGNTVTIIKDKIRSKTKKVQRTDAYSQTNHTLKQGGIEDSTSLTTDHKHRLREVDVHKRVQKHRIVTDKYGKVISDSVKVREKNKVKKKEKDIRTSEFVHTRKSVPPGGPPAKLQCRRASRSPRKGSS